MSVLGMFGCFYHHRKSSHVLAAVIDHMRSQLYDVDFHSLKNAEQAA